MSPGWQALCNRIERIAMDVSATAVLLSSEPNHFHLEHLRDLAQQMENVIDQLRANLPKP